MKTVWKPSAALCQENQRAVVVVEVQEGRGVGLSI